MLAQEADAEALTQIDQAERETAQDQIVNHSENELELPLAQPPVRRERADPEERRRARTERIVGDLRLLSQTELRRRRASIVPELTNSQIMTLLGAVGVVTGIIMAVVNTGDCFSRISFTASSAARCDGSGGMAGLVIAGVGGLSLLIGAIWLGVVDRYRRRLDLALRPDSFSFDIDVTPHGGALTVRGRY